jgi:hypothetical protein
LVFVLASFISFSLHRRTMEEGSFLPLGRGCQLLAFGLIRSRCPGRRPGDDDFGVKIGGWLEPRRPPRSILGLGGLTEFLAQFDVSGSATGAYTADSQVRRDVQVVEGARLEIDSGCAQRRTRKDIKSQRFDPHLTHF